MYRTILLLIFAAICGGSICRAQQVADFAGTWVLKSDGQPVLKLKLTFTTEGRHVAGSLTIPKKLTIDQDGDVTAIGPEQQILPVQESTLKSEQLELVIDGNRFIMKLESDQKASLAPPFGMRPWTLERVSDSDSVVLATRLSEPDYPEEIRALRERLRAMVKEDQDARLAFDLARAAAVDDDNRPELLRIFDQYGWVTFSLAGKEAAHSFWLLIQHQTPEIQQRLLPALEKAAKAGDASMSDYAYLYDRVQVGLGKPQHWGSQTRCQEGKPELAPVDHPDGLDARRKELFMQPIDEYLRIDYLVQSCARAGK